MSARFVSKVETQRLVLSVVNTSLPAKHQLTGLSDHAIESWCRRLGTERTKMVAPQLRTLSTLCHLLADRSNETFQPIDASAEQRIVVSLEDLRKSVQVMVRYPDIES